MDATETVKTFFASIEGKDWDRFSEVTSEEFQFWRISGFPVDRKGYISFQKRVQEAIPDWSYNLSAVREEGNCVVAEVHISGTHLHQFDLPIPGFAPIPPTHIKFEFPMNDAVVTLKEGKVFELNVERSFQRGFLVLLSRLGFHIPGYS